MVGGSAAARLRQAIILNDLPLVQRLIRANPGCLRNPDFEDKSNSSLHIAASHGFLHIVEYLIDQGHDRIISMDKDIYSQTGSPQGISINTDGHTPLHLATLHLHTSVVELLCKEFPATVNRTDKEGSTPLLLAAKAQPKLQIPASTVQYAKPTIRAAEDTSTIETLLAFGADVGAQDKKGNTSLHNACAWGNLKAIRALMQAGVDPLCANYAGWQPGYYSLTVQAEVYFRNLVAEYEKRKAEEKQSLEERRQKLAGSVRLVSEDDESDEESDEVSSPDSFSGRLRAGSGRSIATADSSM